MDGCGSLQSTFVRKYRRWFLCLVRTNTHKYTYGAAYLKEKTKNAKNYVRNAPTTMSRHPIAHVGRMRSRPIKKKRLTQRLLKSFVACLFSAERKKNQ